MVDLFLTGPPPLSTTGTDRSVSQWLMNHINNKITYHVVEDIRTRAFAHLEKLPLMYIDSHPSGDVISRVIADIAIDEPGGRVGDGGKERGLQAIGRQRGSGQGVFLIRSQGAADRGS